MLGKNNGDDKYSIVVEPTVTGKCIMGRVALPTTRRDWNVAISTSRCSSTVEQTCCKHQVTGSTPVIGSSPQKPLAMKTDARSMAMLKCLTG